VPTLEALLASRHDVAGVVTQPDRPSGRGQHPHSSPIKQVAQVHTVHVPQPERLRDEPFLAALRALNADLGVVAAYGKILTDSVLQVPRLGLLNVHASLLPNYRGAAPIHRAVMAGDTETGVTIMRVVKALDAGPMVSRVTRPIGPEETSVEVERDLARLGAEALVKDVDALSAGTAIETPQDESAATYAHKLQKTDGLIDWSRSAQAIHNQIRGLHPWPHAFSHLDGRRVLLLESRVEDSATKVAPYRNAPRDRGAAGNVSVGRDFSRATPGTIVEAAGDDLCVQTGDGVLRIVRLRMEGKRSMAPREFLAGHRVATGHSFA